MFAGYCCSACICSCTHISQDGCTALYLAAQEGHEDVVELLLKAKANPQLKTEVVDYEHRVCSANCDPSTNCMFLTHSNLSPLMA